MKLLTELAKKNYCFERFYNKQFIFTSEDGSYTVFIPEEDIGNGDILAYEKGISLLKWIKKQIDLIEKEKKEQNG
jgi:hypothetical protein